MVEWVAPLRTLITQTKVVILFSDRRFTQCLQLDFHVLSYNAYTS